MALTRVARVPVSELAERGLLPDATPPNPLVLVVDDEVVIADTLAAILNHHGFAATATYDSGTALHLAKIVPPQLLISDISMPEMNGIQLAIRIRTQVPDCCVLLLTGQAITLEILLEARTSGYEFPILSKPVNPDELIAHIHELSAFDSNAVVADQGQPRVTGVAARTKAMRR